MFGTLQFPRIPVAIAVLLMALSSPVETGRAAAGVDVAIVLALDVSASVDAGEFDLMREGLARAITSAELATAISHGQLGSVGFAVVQWSGFSEQEIKIGWTRVSTPAELGQFAKRIRAMPRRYDGGATDIGGALEFSRKLIQQLPFPATRQVIDVAGDGPNNVNYAPTIERDKSVALGMTINGLAIVGEVPVLVDYYEQFIIGGKGAFVEKTNDFDGFERAMRKKLLREVGTLLLF